MSLVGELRRELPSFKMDGREKETGKGGGEGKGGEKSWEQRRGRVRGIEGQDPEVVEGLGLSK